MEIMDCENAKRAGGETERSGGTTGVFGAISIAKACRLKRGEKNPDIDGLVFWRYDSRHQQPVWVSEPKFLLLVKGNAESAQKIRKNKPDHMREYAKRYRLKNLFRVRAQARDLRAKNPEKYKNHDKQRWQRRKGKVIEYRKRKGVGYFRALKASWVARISSERKAQIRANNRAKYREKRVVGPFELTVEIGMA